MFKKQKAIGTINLKTCLRIIPLIVFSGFWVLAAAQGTGGSPGERQPGLVKNGGKDSTKGSGGLEQEITITMPIPQVQFSSCESYISFQSHQRDKLARVVSTIENQSCTSSTGEFELLITVRDGNGVNQTLSFDETWEQANDATVEFSRDYPIGENVTLKGVMARGIRCECQDSPGGQGKVPE
jgi:hypothetical protein